MNLSPHVLVVEDLDFWQEALGEILVDIGYRVQTASSYSEALDALHKNEVHLAVIDPVLDDANRHNRDGLRLLEYILDQQPAIRTMVVTASDPNRIYQEVREISTSTPVLYKDKWDDAKFLAVVLELMNVKGSEQCPVPAF